MFKLKTIILFAITLCINLPCTVAAQPDSTNSVLPAPVLLGNDTLFFITHKAGSQNPKERAVKIYKRLVTLTAVPYFYKDSLKIIDDAYSSDIVYGDLLIHSVFDFDVIDTTFTRHTFAANRLNIISNAVDSYSSKNRFKIFLIKGLVASGIILLLVLIIWVIKRMSTPFLNWFLNKFKIKFKNLYIGNYLLFSGEVMVRYVTLSYKLIRTLLTLLIVYLTLPFLFKLFPATESIAIYMWKLIWDPVKNILVNIVHYIPKLFAIIVISIVFYYLIKLLKYFMHEIETGKLKINGFYEEWASPTFSLIKMVVIVFYVIVIYPFLPGSDSKIFQGVSVFLGLLISIGSSSAIANIVSGLVITYMRPFKINSFVKIGEVTGTVVEKNLLVTRIKTIKNEEVTIPNSAVLSSYSMNYGSTDSNDLLIVHTTVTIGYDAPWKVVHELLINAALKTEHIVAKPDPFVLQTALSDFYVNYQINAYTNRPHHQAIILSNLHQQIQDKFNDAGVEIMSAHYSYLRDGNKTTIPADYLDENYKAPRFNVNVETPDKKESTRQLKLNL